MVMDEGQLSPEDALVESDSLHHVMAMLETMDQREATVLRMRFGLDNHEPRTLKEIGEQLGLTRERVRQIETEALNRMADSMEDSGPADGDLRSPKAQPSSPKKTENESRRNIKSGLPRLPGEHCPGLGTVIEQVALRGDHV